jgi:hypothetical protein
LLCGRPRFYEPELFNVNCAYNSPSWSLSCIVVAHVVPQRPCSMRFPDLRLYGADFLNRRSCSAAICIGSSNLRVLKAEKRHAGDDEDFAMPRHVSPNDEVERRRASPTTNGTDLSRSSTLSLAHRRYCPRDRSNRLLGDLGTQCIRLFNVSRIYRFLGTVDDDHAYLCPPPIVPGDKGPRQKS